jgi:SAM-dependent methyltransferase
MASRAPTEHAEPETSGVVAAPAQPLSALGALESLSASVNNAFAAATRALESELAITKADFERARAESADMATALRQALDAIANARLPAPPPAYLQKRVVGAYHPSFMSSGDKTLEDFTRILAGAGVDIASLRDVLDFGVGCGRVARRFAEVFAAARIVGADIDAEAIRWLQDNYGGRYGTFLELPFEPPCSLPSDSFDLVYAVSVFTHLNEDMQFGWLDELRRLTRRGGYVILTVHGDHYVSKFPEDWRNEISGRGIFFNDKAETTLGLPDFYKNTYHTKAYIEREWARYFKLIAYEDMGCEGHQDLILLQRAMETL